ncbi:putative Ankyrin repeat-containing protein [Hibiscus syriacus]|uniref:Ankyrin repeat-containing protein n=1 Tax=Hibiscus syriacus TaxID=106335 RepID=A0A6A2YSA3_HIBSY|nr:putative Ankyrin repeat-containing protein [Hibiscus syriacus]
MFSSRIELVLCPKLTDMGTRIQSSKDPENTWIKLSTPLSTHTQGKAYYTFEFMTQAPNYTRHTLTAVSIGNGKFYTLTTGANERRWDKMKDRLMTVGSIYLDRIDEIPFVDTPVHIAVTSGHADFAVEVMNLKSSFARKLNKDGYSPVHLAFQNERTLLRLVERDKDLIRVKGREGCTPLHYAAEHGNLNLLAKFLVACPESIHDLTIRDETALHVAAKNNKLETLRILAQLLRRTYFYSSSTGKKLLNWKDKDGNTVLHVAAYNNQPKMIKLLLDCKVNVNEINSSGKTPLDVIQELQIPDEASKNDATRILLNAEALNASSTPRPQHLHERLRSNITFTKRAFGEVFNDITNMSAKKSGAVLVILVLILTSTYQATLSPPSGVLQGDGGDSHDLEPCSHASRKMLQKYALPNGEPEPSNRPLNHVNSKEGKSTLNSAAFIMFYVPNTLAFIMTFILTLGLLAIVASGPRRRSECRFADSNGENEFLEEGSIILKFGPDPTAEIGARESRSVFGYFTTIGASPDETEPRSVITASRRVSR